MFYSKNLEIHIVDHCNLDCIGCSHESPFIARRFDDPESLERSLRLLWKYYRSPLLKFLGGEPLLHPNISEILSKSKELTHARLRIVTNGTLLRRRYLELRGVDEIHISSYPDVPIPSDAELILIAAELGASITIQRFNHFRWHHSPPRNDTILTERIFTTCQLYHDWQCHTLRDGWFYPCSMAATWGSKNRDGVNLLASGESIETKLGQLLKRKIPLESCVSCFGSVGKRFQHGLGWRMSQEKALSSDIDKEFLKRLELDPDTHNGCFEYERTFHPSEQIEHHNR